MIFSSFRLLDLAAVLFSFNNYTASAGWIQFWLSGNFRDRYPDLGVCAWGSTRTPPKMLQLPGQKMRNENP
jgi:hypothetical protein